MHIALVNQWYPPTSVGGVAQHNVQFAEACVRLGHQVTVITARRNPTVLAIDELNGVKIVRVAPQGFYNTPLRRLPILGKHLRSFDALNYSRKVCKVLADIHRQAPVDVAEFAEVNAEGFFWKPTMSRRLVLRCHTPQFILSQAQHYEAPYNTAILNWAEKRVIRRTHWFTAPSKDMAEIIHIACDVPIERFCPIPNALDIDRYAPDGELAADGITILYVGRLERAKGIEQLINAIPRVCDSVPDARFVLVGADRPRRNEGVTHGDYVRRHLGHLIDAGRLELRGRVSDEELIAAYQFADIAVVPSINYESFSYTVAQAMSCGLPVVASDIGGIAETLDYGRCGVLVEPDNVDALTDGLLQLCRDEALRQQMGEAGRNRCVEVFNATAVARRVLAYYEKALA